jgi:hypothetical protein
MVLQNDEDAETVYWLKTHSLWKAKFWRNHYLVRNPILRIADFKRIFQESQS